MSDSAFAAYLQHHFWSWEPCWKQVTCRTVPCETCHKERIARWVQVCYGDEGQNVRSTYCSFECAATDEDARKRHCFKHRVVLPPMPTAEVPKAE